MGRFYSDREVKVIAVFLGAIPDDADDLYLPVGEGVTGRQEHVAAIAMMRRDAPLPDDAETYVVEERPQWDRGGETITRIAFVRYVQNIVVESAAPTAPEVDGIAELGFRTLKDVHQRMYDSPAGAQIIRRDIQRFLDVPAGWRMLAQRARPARP